MRVIDIHAHHSPESFVRSVKETNGWHGLEFTPSMIRAVEQPRGWTPERRVAAMDSMGVDIQVLSTYSRFYCYEQDAEPVAAMHRECNDEIREWVVDHPSRFAGLALVPMQDVKKAVTELDRAVNVLGLKGAMIGDHVNGVNYDEAEFHPFWEAAEAMGALIFVHQHTPTTVVAPASIATSCRTPWATSSTAHSRSQHWSLVV